ncbi:hypothetical protein Tco_1064902 [Tanacetum coccineum]
MKEKITNPSSGFNIRVDAIPTATKPPSIVNWKIIPQLGQKFVYQIIRADGSHKIYMSFGAIVKDFSRDDLTELFKLVIKKYGANRPEEAYDRVLWGDLKTMFDPPLSEDAIWSLPLQQKMLRWRQKISSIKGCLPSYAEYEALRRCKEQTATGKEISNPLIADSLLKTISCDAEVDDADKDLKTKYDLFFKKTTIALAQLPPLLPTSPAVIAGARVLGSAAIAFQSSLHHEDHEQEVLDPHQLSFYHVCTWSPKGSDAK